MKLLIPALSLLLSLNGFTPSPASPAGPLHASPAARSAEVVYVCMSKRSVAYHSHGRCAGLTRYEHEVRAMRVSDAQRLGKRACMKCY